MIFFFRQKKILRKFSNKNRLIESGVKVGPLTDTTRSIYLKKLTKLHKIAAGDLPEEKYEDDSNDDGTSEMETEITENPAVETLSDNAQSLDPSMEAQPPQESTGAFRLPLMSMLSYIFIIYDLKAVYYRVSRYRFFSHDFSIR